MSEFVEFVVGEAQAGLRLDVTLRAHYSGWSRRRIARALEEGRVTVDGHPARKGQVVHDGARVVIQGLPDTPENLRPVPEEAALTVLYEDAAIVSVSKPAGIPSHPLRAGERGTLANALVARFAECAGASTDPREAGLCHRLDTGTSGVLVAARTRDAYLALRLAFRTGRVEKEYLALVSGEAVTRVVRMPTADRSIPAETRIEPIERFGTFTLVRCTTSGGQRHQVRVHLAEAGHAVAGDERYGGSAVAGLGGFFLHAASVRLPHPLTGATIEIHPQ